MSLTDGIALWLENAGAVHKAHYYQQLLSGLTGHRSAVLGLTDLKVVQRGAGANLSVDVGAGDVVIRATLADSVGSFGSYFVRNNATVNLAVGAADPSNTRNDLVVIDVRDSERTGIINDARLRIVQGTPSGTPLDPTIPANSIVLARLVVTAGDTAINTGDIADLRFNAIQASQPGELAATRQPWHTAWGIVAPPIATASSATATSGATDTKDVVIGDYTFTAIANRRYVCRLGSMLISSGTANDLFQIRIRNGGASSPTNASTTVAGTQAFVGVAGGPGQAGTPALGGFSLAAGTATLGLFLARVAGTGPGTLVAAVGLNRELWVEDVGPIGVPQ